MNIIRNNYNKKKDTIQTICENCESELEFTGEDVHYGYLGMPLVTCPCCGEETSVLEDGVDTITLTVDNIQFPVHFLHTTKNERYIKPVEDEEIIEEIKKGIAVLRSDEEGITHWYTCCGNLFIVIFRLSGDEEYWVIVTKDYYETSIPFEECDYRDDE